MKHPVTVLAFLLAALTGFSQEKVIKDKKEKLKKENNSVTRPLRAGKSHAMKAKVKKNIPTPVLNAFTEEYPIATKTIWTKTEQGWKATFNHQIQRMSVTYRSNGEKVDSRMPIQKENLPRTVLDEIRKCSTEKDTKKIIKIEKPNNPDLYQVIVNASGKKKILVINENGNLVSEK